MYTFQSLKMFNECGYVYNNKLFIEYEFCFCYLYSSIDMIIYNIYLSISISVLYITSCINIISSNVNVLL